MLTLLLIWLAAPAYSAGPTNARGYRGISSSQPTGSPSIAKDKLVAAYDMEITTGDGHLKDFSGNENHGTIHGTALVKGVFGKARRFASVQDRIALPSNKSFAIDGPLSVTMWVRVHRLGLHQHMLACDDKFAFWITADDHLRFVDTLGHGLQTKGGLATETWYSIVGVFRGNIGDVLTRDNIAVYVNGNAVDGSAARAWAPGILHPTDACYIGFESHQGAESHKTLHFDGDIDEVLIFSRALTDPEIQAHANRRRE